MPVFTAAGGFVASTVFGLTAGTASFAITSSLVAAGLAVGVGKLTGAFDVPEFGGAEDTGVEARVNANPLNPVPALYGNWMQRGIITFFEASPDRSKLYAVVTLGEGPATSIDDIYWDDLKLTLDANGNVTSAVDAEGTVVDKLNGNVNVQTYTGGADNASTYLQGELTNWDSTHKMTGLIYAVITVNYNRDKGVTGLSDMRFVGTSPISNPAQVVKDQLQNDIYGLALADTDIDGDSFDTAEAYFDELVSYVDRDGITQQAKRFEVNGTLPTSNTVKNRIEGVLEGSNSSLKWSNGQYSLFVNKANTPVAFNFNEENIIGSIEVAEVGMNNLVNKLVVNYGRDEANNWQRNTIYLESPDSVKYPNEPLLERSIDLPLVATNIEAQRVATIILNQARQQLAIKHTADATAMSLEAGDVITYTDEDYGWDDKQFRIISIQEVDQGSTLTYTIQAVEYSSDVYADSTLNEVDVAPNIGSIDNDNIPPVTDLAASDFRRNGSPPRFNISWTRPANAYIDQFDIYYGSSTDDFEDSQFLRGVRNPGGRIYTSGESVVESIENFSAGSYRFWVVGSSPFGTSIESNTASVSNWLPVISSTSQEIVRLFSENNVDDDPGNPGEGTDGSGNTDWYAFDPDASTEDYPHWEATGVAEQVGGANRDITFTTSGVSGDEAVVSTDVNQIIDFTFSGTAGKAVEYAPRSEEGTFTFTGNGAEADSVDPGLQEVWKIVSSGSSDASISADNEEFYIAMAGNSGDTPATVQGEYYLNVTGDTGTLPVNGEYYVAISGDAVLTPDNDLGESNIDFTANPLGESQSIPPYMGWSQFPRIVVQNDQQALSILNLFSDTPLSAPQTLFFGNDSGVYISMQQGTTVVTIEVSSLNWQNNNKAILVVATNNRNLESESNWDYYFGTPYVNNGDDHPFVEPSSGITVGRRSYADPVDKPNNNSTVSLVVTEDSISYTQEFSEDLNTDLAVRDYYFDQISLVTGITNTFTLSKDTAMVGEDSSYPVVKFVAKDFDTHTFSVSALNPGSGTLGVSSDVLVDSKSSSTSTVRIEVDSLNKTYQLTENLSTDSDIADDLVTKLNADSSFTGYTITSATEVIDSVSTAVVKFVSDDNNAHTFTFTATDNSGDITLSSGVLVENNDGSILTSTVRVQIPTESLDTTITLTADITGDTLLCDDLSTQLNLITDFTDEFTITSTTEEINGVADVPIVKLVANDNTNHTIATTFTSREGNIEGSSSGSLVDGTEEFVSTTLRLGYDSSLTPSFQDITFGAQNSVQMAEMLTSTIDGHGDLISTQGDTFTIQDGVIIDPDHPSYLGSNGFPERFRFSFFRSYLENLFAFNLGGTVHQFNNNDTTASSVTTVSFRSSSDRDYTGESILIYQDNSNYAYYEITASTATPYSGNIDVIEATVTYLTDESLGNPDREASACWQRTTKAANDSIFATISSSGATLHYEKVSPFPPTNIPGAIVGNYVTAISQETKGAFQIAPPTTVIQTSMSRIVSYDSSDDSVELLEVLQGDSDALSNNPYWYFLNIPNLGPIESADIGTTFTEDLTSSSNLIKPEEPGNLTQPVLTVLTQGTGDASFVISTELEGRDDVPGSPAFTEYEVSLGSLNLLSGSFQSNSSPITSATRLSEAIDGLDAYTASSSQEVLTFSGSNDSDDELTITITAGVNDSNGTSLNNLAQTKVVTQKGFSVAKPGGEDSTVIVRVDSDIYSSTSADFDDLLSTIATNVSADINAAEGDNNYTSTATGAVSRSISAFTGPTPVLSAQVVVGSTSVIDLPTAVITNTDADLAVATTVVNNGENVISTTGEFSTYTVSQGSDVVIASTELEGALTSAEVALVISDEINDTDGIDYAVSSEGSVISAISTFQGTSPDLTITIGAGKNTDDTAATLSLATVINDPGLDPTLSYEDTVWDYYIISREQQGDGDFTGVTDGGQITVNRGLVLNAATLGEVTTDYTDTMLEFTERYTTGANLAQLEFSGGVVLPCISSVTAGNTVGFNFQYSTDPDDDDPTWTTLYSSPLFPLTTTAALAGQLLTPNIPLVGSLSATAATEYGFRIVRTGVNPGSGGLLATTLILEELRNS